MFKKKQKYKKYSDWQNFFVVNIYEVVYHLDIDKTDVWRRW